MRVPAVLQHPLSDAPQEGGAVHLPRALYPHLSEPRELYPHQWRALAWACSQDHPAFFMEMRLGKTLTTIRFAQGRALKTVLVVCPAPVCHVWETELASEGIASTVLRGPGRAELVRDGWNIVSYESLRGCPSLARRQWDIAILDESTRIRNPQAAISKLICNNLGAFAKFRAILTGLPDPEGVQDFFQQMNFLLGEFMGCRNFWQWRNRYFTPDAHGWYWHPNPGAEALIREEISKHALVIRRKDCGMGSKKIRQVRLIEMTPTQRRIHKEALEKWATEGRTTRSALTPLLWASRAAGGFSPSCEMIGPGKLRELETLLTGELARDQAVVWFRFRAEMAAAWQRLIALGDVAEIHGDITGHARDRALADFQSGKARVLLAQVHTAKYGLDCSAASAAIYYSNDYEFEARAQSEDRIVHPAKNEPLLYVDLVSKGSIDEKVLSVLGGKRAGSERFIERLAEVCR